MWKGAAVIGGDCGGIRHQIEDGVNGYLVSSVEAAAQRIVQLLREPAQREHIKRRARDTVRRRFLMSRLLEQYLDLFSAFEATFSLNHQRLSVLGLPVANKMSSDNKSGT